MKWEQLISKKRQSEKEPHWSKALTRYTVFSFFIP